MKLALSSPLPFQARGTKGFSETIPKRNFLTKDIAALHGSVPFYLGGPMILGCKSGCYEISSQNGEYSESLDAYEDPNL